MSEDQVAEGAAAWLRIKAHSRISWDSWRLIGIALRIGRDQAMSEAKARSPHGKKYTKLMTAFLRKHGFDDIVQPARYRALLCIDNLEAIEAFRDGLTEPERLRLNHPDSVFWAWKRAQNEGKPARKYSRPERPTTVYCRRNFDQDCIRRVAAALRLGWSTDTYKLALVALDAVSRELLPPEPKPAKPAPRRVEQLTEAFA